MAGIREADRGRVSARIAYWRRAHHDWKFWVAMVLMFAALAMYVMSDNLALVPRWR
jgi:hypothetical protein